MTANETDLAAGTRSTRPEASAEAASDAPTGSPSQPRPTLPEGMGELDRRAIDTVRVLAMDAVQKAGNGHPGTAMSMGPTAYLLFQKWLRHDPGDPSWAGRDRFVLSMGHSSLTLYIQLFLSGYGLELSDLEALRTWGSRTPGHPEVNHTPGVETTTGPLGQGVGNAVGMAMAACRERGLLDPDAPAGESVFDHTIWAFASDGDLEEGVSGEASSLAGTQELGNLVLVYDANRISIEDDTGRRRILRVPGPGNAPAEDHRRLDEVHTAR
jgi:transketolase